MSDTLSIPPILFLIFNRPDVTKAVFAEIKKAKPEKLYIACDGPRPDRENEKQIVANLRQDLLDNIDWSCSVKTLFREENLGCGYAVSEAISWFFDNEPMGIILEDDCVPSPSFFPYCNELLHKYQNDRRVWYISGTSFLNPGDLEDSSYYFSPITQMWGWATWRDRWAEYDFHMKKYKSFIEHKYLDGIANSFRIKQWFKDTLEYNQGITTNWDCQWFFTTLVNRGLCVVPKVNLIRNVGFDLAESAHIHGPDKILAAMILHELELPLIHPQTFCIDTHLDAKFFVWRTDRFKLSRYVMRLLFKPIQYIDNYFFNRKLLSFYKQARLTIKKRFIRGC
jgi:hypothetical protein